MKRLDRSAKQRAPRAGPAWARGQAGLRLDNAEIDLEVGEIGARGDGTAQGPDGPVYAAFVLPGEMVRARVAGDRGEVLAVLAPSADRVQARCAHFGRCGGCQLQHWAEEPYLAWKREQVVRALARRALEVEVDPIIPAWGQGRRRAGFHAARGQRFGFIERGGATIIPIEACPALDPALAAALPALKALGSAFAPQKGEAILQCIVTDAGLDVDIKGVGGAGMLDRAGFERAVAAADAADLARLSFDGETVIARRTPMLTMGLARVAPPPAAFLQPTALGEETLAALALEALAGAHRVVDLFAGLGTFALRLAAHAETHAVDGDMNMIAALKQAADATGGRLKQVTVERRDLMRTPLSALEMKRFDACAFDPPRSGARLQAEQIAKAPKITKVAAISCDPATFARDARVLVDAGFTLKRVTPVDQFRWSPHVEVVGAFER